MRIHIRGGRLVDPANKIDEPLDVFISDGLIAAIGSPPFGFRADRELDARGCIVAPGLIDLAVRLGEPGFEHKATIASEAKAAAAAGITTVCCPPDTQPVIDTPAVLELVHQRAEAAGLVRVVALGALTQNLDGVTLSAMAALKEAGCVGVTNAYTPVQNPLIMRRALEYAATFNLTAFLVAEDQHLRNSGCINEGAVGTRLGLPGVPHSAETVAVARDLALIEQTGARAHFCRLSTAQATQMIARAQYDGLPVSADVSAHHLHLTDMDCADFNSDCHVRPPLRTQRDRDKLRQGVASNTIAAICSDHQPHEADAKRRPFAETEAGISALETLLPLSLRLVHDRALSVTDMVARLSTQPASILGIDGGNLSVGQRADICVFDLDTNWQVHPSTLVSRGRNTPFFGWDLQGRVKFTLLKGSVVFAFNSEDGAKAR